MTTDGAPQSVSLAAGIALHRRSGRTPRPADDDLTPAQRLDDYVGRLDGCPVVPWRDVHPMPVLDAALAAYLRAMAGARS